MLGAEREVVHHGQLQNIDPTVDNQLPRFGHAKDADDELQRAGVGYMQFAMSCGAAR